MQQSKSPHPGQTIASPVHDLDLPGRADLFPILYDLARVPGLDFCTDADLAQPLTNGT